MSKLRFGYNTNGFAHHRLEDTLQILDKLGYESVAITLDHDCLNPFERKSWRARLPEIRRRLAKLANGAVIETGARFLLDPYRKHQPTLVSKSIAERRVRFDFLRRAIALAAELEVRVVSFWSGRAIDGGSFSKHMRRLTVGCQRVCDFAQAKGVRLAFEPEPGMFIDTMAKYQELYERVNDPAFGLTIDVGHLHCLADVPIAKFLRAWKDVLWNIHIEDMKRWVHEHLMFGEGEIDFRPVLRTLQEINYQGGVHVELSRHSHDAVETARKALAFLKAHS